MRTLIIGLVSFFIISSAQADASLDPLIHKVTLQLSAEQWVTTKNALVTVSVNASVNDNSIDKIQAQVLEKLTQLSKSEWRIVSYDRSEDKSGLEGVKIIAQGRLLESDLNGLRERAKNLSKPGETYTIDTIQFVPSDEEKRTASNALRENVYEQVKNELDRLNKIYSDQKYSVHEINFFSEAMPMPMAAQNAMYKMGEANGTGGAASAHSPMNVGDKMRLNATVTLSTSPDPNLLKPFIH